MMPGKRWRSAGAAAVLAVSLACAPSSGSEFSESQRHAIADTIRAHWADAMEGIAEANAEQAFSVFSHTALDRYVRDGYLYPTIDAAQAEYRRGFREIREQTISYDTLEVQVFDRSTAVLTAVGKVVSVDTLGNASPEMSLAWTNLWRRSDSGWAIVNMHISFPPGP